MRRTARLAIAVAAAALVAGGLGAGIAAPPVEVGAGDDWPVVGGGIDETNFSRLEQINTGNIGQLGLAASTDLPGEVTLEATPVEVGGTIYFTGTYAKVYAVDALSGKIKWTYDPQTWKNYPMAMHFSFGANRGVAYENGKIFSAAMDGRLFALDAATGKELWVTQTVPKGINAIITGAPRVMNGVVIIGNGGADFGTRGYVSAYDATSGKQLWKFFITPASPEENKGDPAMEAAAKTWTGEFWKKTGGGGGPWNALTFDPELNRVYVPTGNDSPYDPEVRGPGSNLYTASIVALDARTGKYIWHYQPVPADSWDYDNTAQISLADVVIGGRMRKVLMQTPKSGFFYVLDRETGKLLNAPGKTTEVTWARGVDLKTGLPIEEPNIRYESGSTSVWPGSVGGHDWQPMAYDPKLGLAFIPVQQIGARFTRGGETSDTAFNVMGIKTEPVVEKPGDGKGHLVAWDPIGQKKVWEVHNKNLWNGGVLATAGGLVFQGTAEGTINAYDSKTGKQVWQFDAGLGIVGAPMSYTVGGKQYVSILVGYGGTSAAFGKLMDVGWKYGAQQRRLLTFAIGGTAKLAKMPGPDFTVHALDDPKVTLDPKDVAAGRAAFVQCAACHGVGTHATGTPAPDLKESAIALDLASFTQVLKQGLLMEQGMPRFEYLTDDQIRQLYAYVRYRSRESLGLIKAPEPAMPKPKL